MLILNFPSGINQVILAALGQKVQITSRHAPRILLSLGSREGLEDSLDLISYIAAELGHSLLDLILIEPLPSWPTTPL